MVEIGSLAIQINGTPKSNNDTTNNGLENVPPPEKLTWIPTMMVWKSSLKKWQLLVSMLDLWSVSPFKSGYFCGI